MGTLLKPGDMIRIRDDIEESISYKMILDEETTNSWIDEDMLPSGTLVKIINISSGQYVVNAVDYVHDNNKLYGDDFWLYTDQMFDPDMILLLYEERYENNL